MGRAGELGIAAVPVSRLRRAAPAALALLVALAGCYWQKYDRLVRTHVEVLTSMAAKASDVREARGGYRPGDLAELRYPYDRARDFARIVRDRFGGRESFRRLEALLGTYEKVLAVVDRLNAQPEPVREDVAELSRLVRETERAGRAVLEALEAEWRG